MAAAKLDRRRRLSADFTTDAAGDSFTGTATGTGAFRLNSKPQSHSVGIIEMAGGF